MRNQAAGPAKKNAAPPGLKLTIAAILVVTILACSLHLFPASLTSLQLRQHELADAYRHSPILVMSLFFAAAVALTTLSVPGAIVITTTAAGAIFGFATGTTIASFGAAVGSSLAFLCSRYLLRDWAMLNLARYMPEAGHRLRDDLGWYLLSLRLIPAVPFFLVNISMSVTGIRLSRFYLISQAGMLPCVMVYVNAGQQFGVIRSAGDLLSIRVLGALALLGIFPVAMRLIAGNVGSNAS